MSHPTGQWIDGDDSEMPPGIWLEMLSSGELIAFLITEPEQYWLHSGRIYYRMGDIPELPPDKRGQA